ncbi:MAG TPA: ANTAR domain-containing protein [Methylophilus sp.]|uniref:ANTAR domain-containing protein n=1 Tax=Methylophilus sp. TaxID=29541 RepID=UPI002BCDF2CB|nr:ANTAR domain-containing protein [Methylophilus sp.]HSH87963.1 ANTAR domain-containing protein [Methylophilus sp.]
MRPTTPNISTSAALSQHALLSLEDQKVVDSARDILMRQRALNEEEAYSLLSEMADKRKTGMADISLQLINITKRLTV